MLLDSDVLARHGIVPFSVIPPSGAEYIIPGVLQLGAINIIQGEPGFGKTSVAVAMGASISGGNPIPGLPVLIHGPVLFLSDEDSAGQIRIALDANKANVDMCHTPTRHGTLTIQSPDLAEIMEQLKPVLIVIDPIQEYLGPINLNQADQLRPALAYLCSIARQHNCAIAIIAHTGKSRTDKSQTYQSIGSIDLPAAARCISACTANPNGKGYVLTPIKCSSGPIAPAVTYNVSADKRVLWGDVLGDLADPLISDPLYHTIMQLVDSTDQDVYTWSELESAALSITGRSLGGWDLMSLKLRSAVGALLEFQGITVTLQGDNEDDRCVCIRTPYVISGVLEDSHE